MWLVTFTRRDPGDCTWNPSPFCLPAAGCIFSVRIDIWDNCGAVYTTTLCNQFIDANGNPVGSRTCGPSQPVPPPPTPPGPATPIIVTNLGVGCGREDSLVFQRTLNNVTVTFLTVATGCTGCPTGS